MFFSLLALTLIFRAEASYNPSWTSSIKHEIITGSWSFANGMIVSSGNAGIGTITPMSKLGVSGNLAIGTIYAGNNAAPANGLAVEGSVAIGTSFPTGKLDIVGGPVLIWQGNGANTEAADAGELYVQNDLEVDGSIYANGQKLVCLSDGTNCLPNGAGWTDGGSAVYQTTLTDKVGIGISAPANILDINGGVVIGTAFAGNGLAPSNGIAVQGNVGIGTTRSLQKLSMDCQSTDTCLIDVYGSNQTLHGQFGYLSNQGFVQGAITGNPMVYTGFIHIFRSNNFGTEHARIDQNGRLGLGTSTPQNKLDVEGGSVIGAGYSGTYTAPSNGLAIEGNLGIGTINPLSKFMVAGNAAIGTTSAAAPANGLYVYGNVGINSSSPLGKLSVQGNGTATGVVFQTTNSSNAAEMTVLDNGNIGVGITAPSASIHVGPGGAPNVAGADDVYIQNDLEVDGTITAASFYGSGAGLTNISNAGGWTNSGTNIYQTVLTDKVGIGTSAPTNLLDITSGTVIGASYVGASRIAPVNGLLVEGNVGIGTINPTVNLQVRGDVLITSNLRFNNNLVNVNGDTIYSGGTRDFFTAGSYGGIHSFAIYDNTAASAVGNGALISFRTNRSGGDMEPRVGSWSENIGAGTYQAGLIFQTVNASTTPQTQMIVSGTGNVGIGTVVPLSKLMVNGAVSIGTTAVTPPVNGLYVEGSAGIGSASPIGKLDIVGDEVRVWTGGGADNYALSSGTLYVENTLEVDGSVHFPAGKVVIGGKAVCLSDGTNCLTDTLSGSGTQNYVTKWNNAGGTTIGNSQLIDDGTNVGIASTAPLAKLTVKGNGTTTGLAFQTTDSLDVDKVTILDNGNIGVGGLAPLHKIHISTANGVASTLGISQTGWRTWDIGLNAGSGNFRIQDTTGAVTPFIIEYATATNTLYLDSTNNIGIGTNAPTSRLHIHGSGTTTGQSFAAADSNGVDKFIILDNGNVGIGYTAAGHPLVVNGAVGIGTSLVSANNKLGVSGPVAIGAAYAGTINAPSNGLLVEGNVGIGSTNPSGRLSIRGNGTTTGITFQTINSNNAAKVTILDNGNIGVGNTSPSVKMHISGGSLRVDGAGADLPASLTGAAVFTGEYASPDAGRLIFGDNSGWKYHFSTRAASSTIDRMTIKDDGNVGIGTINPVGKLDVQGDEVRIWDGTATVNIATGNGDLYVENDLEADGTITASTFYGSGAGLTNLTGSGWIKNGTNIYPLTITDNVGVGTSAPLAQFAIYEDALDYAAELDQDNANGYGLLIETDGDAVNEPALRVKNATTEMLWVGSNGNIGIGNSTPANKFGVEGSVAIGATYAGAVTAPVNGLLVQGNVGIGTSAVSNNKLGINGPVAIGAAYAGSYTAPSNGLLVEGNVGIGTITATSKLFVDTSTNASANPIVIRPAVNENLAIRTLSPGLQLVAGNDAASGYVSLKIDGSPLLLNQFASNVGIGTSVVLSKLGIIGGAAIGAAYAGSYTAPSNGLLVEGNVGIGITAPSSKLDVALISAYNGNNTITGAINTWSNASELTGLNLVSSNSSLASGEDAFGIFAAANSTGHWAGTAAGIYGKGTGIRKGVGVGGYGITTSSVTGEAIGVLAGAYASGMNGADVYGVRIDGSNTTSSGGPSNMAYGLYIADNISSPNGSAYSIYSEAAESSYFAGNIGIGYSAPPTNFYIYESNTSTTPAVEIVQNSTGDAALLFDSDGNEFTIGIDSSDSDKLKISDNTSLGTNDRLVIDGNGNVGIGSSNPLYLVDINQVNEGLNDTAFSAHGWLPSATTINSGGAGAWNSNYSIIGTNEYSGSSITNTNNQIINGIRGVAISNAVVPSSNGSINLTALDGTSTGNLGTTGITVHTGVNVSSTGTADTNYGVYTTASGATTNYAIYASAGTCYDGSSGACSLNDIAEFWHSEESLKVKICQPKSDKNDDGIKCHMPDNFKKIFVDGDVICNAEGKKNILRKCRSAYDSSAISVISEEPTIVMGGDLGAPYPVSLAGNAPVNVICDVSIKPGDLLVYSGIENYAMKLDIKKEDSAYEMFEKMKGVIGKALDYCDSGRKKIRMWK